MRELRERRAWYEQNATEPDRVAAARGLLYGIPVGAAMWTAGLLLWWWIA